MRGISPTMLKIISWNIARRQKAWQKLLSMDADIALLQECRQPPRETEPRIETSADYHGAAVVKLSNRVRVQWLAPTPLADAKPGDLAVSHPGSLSAAIVTPGHGEPVTVVSVCAEYEKPHRSTGGMSWNITDASVHRVISDLSLLVGRQRGHRIIVAGDLTVWHGYGDDKSGYWKGRYDTVFDRMTAIGLPLVGPRCPNGRQAVPRPEWLPADSKNVPTFRSPGQQPAEAQHQLDFVFASESLKDSLQVRALNHPDQWGPSDHCRIEIVLPRLSGVAGHHFAANPADSDCCPRREPNRQSARQRRRKP